MTQSIPCSEPEEWRPVVGYEGWYEVSSLGRVRRVRRGYGATFGRILIHRPGRDGYPRVSLCRDSECRTVTVHGLVARAFFGPCPPDHEVNHKDLNHRNARASNLEYLTRLDNVRHAVANGAYANRPHGTDKPNAKLSDDDVRAIRGASGSSRAIGARFGIGHTTVLAIRRRKTWAHVE